MPSTEELAQKYLALARALQGKDDLLIPASVFSSSLSPLRSLVTYLKNIEHYSFKKISAALGRSYHTIYAAYVKELPVLPETEFYIPLTAFMTDLSILESAVKYLKERYDLTLSEIARIFCKDPRTMWATYDRAKKKRGDRRA